MPYRAIDVQMDDEAKRKLGNFLVEKFRLAVTSRITQVESDYARWCKNYEAMPKEKTRTTPFIGAANFIPRLIGMHTDILAARLIGLLFGTKPFWRPRTLIEGNPALQQDDIQRLSQWIEFVTSSGMNWFEHIDWLIFQVVKTGTVTCKFPWKTKELYLGSEGSGGAIAGEKVWRKEGVEVDVIPFEDFYPFPISARNLTQCTIKFHRLRFTFEEVSYRKNARQDGQTWWDEKAANFLVQQGPDGSLPQAASQIQAQASGISLTKDVARPFACIEATLCYELEPGKLYPIVVVFNPSVQNTELTILKAYYSPYERGDLDGYADFRIYPREFYYGNCVPNILEMSQEEQAQIHNGRRDSNTVATTPGWKKKRLAQVGNPSADWYAGKVFIVDAMDDLEPLQFPGNYNSMIDEENMLLQMAERYTGISPAMQGFGAGSQQGKRGVYANSATLALLSEGNKRLDIFLKRLRNSFHQAGRIIFESHRQFRPWGSEYEQFGLNSEAMKKIFELASAEADGYAGVFFELAASDASANKEVDRTALMVMSNTMASYYQQIVALSTQYLSVPEGSPLKPVIASVLEGARDLANRLAFVFDVYDRQRIVPDLSALLGGQRPGPQGPSRMVGGGMSAAEGAVSPEDVSGLASRLTAITGAAGAGAVGPQLVGAGGLI